MKRPPLGLIATALVAVSLVFLALSLVVAGGGYVEPAPGVPSSSPFVAWAVPVLRLLTLMAGIVTIGFVGAAAVLDPSGRDGLVSRIGRADVRRAAISAFVWAALALVQLVFTLADVLAIPFVSALDPAIISTYANELPVTRALLVMAILAVVVGSALIATSTTGAAISWTVVALVAISLPSLAGHAAGIGDHALALTAGAAHAIGATIWIGGLLALGVHATRPDFPLQRSAQRFSSIALVAFVLVLFSGFANGYTRLETPGQLVTTGYGQVLVAKTAIIAGLAALAWILRSRVISSLGSTSRRLVFARIAGLDLTLMAIAVALGVALATSPYPRIDIQFDTLGESLLGFAFPPEPTWTNVIFGFKLEPFFFTAMLVLLGLYVAGYVRLVRRHDRWPVGRLISFVIGVLIVLWCTNGPIAAYAQVSVQLHMLQHMTLSMMAPIMLVLGAPATLALRALKPAKGNERGPREWLNWFLHSWINRLLTNPFYVLFIYGLGLFGLYMTPFFGWLMGSHLGHLYMQVHFLGAGYLFYWVLIGIDPRPKPVPYWGRLLLLLAALSIHGLFAVVLMMDPRPLAPEYFSLVQPPWLTDPVYDSAVGSQIAWGLSEIPTILVIIVVAIQWARSDTREASRNDRRAALDGEAELAAYNDRLARLSQHDQQHQ